MTTQVQVRGNSQATQEARTLATRELDVNTTDKRICIHDGSTAGGIRHVNSFDQVNQEFTYAAASGTNSITISLAVAPTAYAAGQKFVFKAAATNTGSSTLNVNSLGAKTIKKKDVAGGTLATLSAGDIISGGIYTAFYDGTDMLLESVDSGGGGWVLVDSYTGTSPSLTLDGSIESYQILVKSVVISSAVADLQMHLRRSSTSQVFPYTTEYRGSTSGSTYNDTGFLENAAGSSTIQIGRRATTSATNYFSGNINLPNLGSTLAMKSANWRIDCSSDPGSYGYHTMSWGSCSRRDASAYDEVTFSTSAGSISSSDIELWGYSG